MAEIQRILDELDKPTSPEIVAGYVASRLIDDLKSGAIPVINIDVIRAAIRKELGAPDDFEISAYLEELTTRKVIFAVG